MSMILTTVNGQNFTVQENGKGNLYKDGVFFG